MHSDRPGPPRIAVRPASEDSRASPDTAAHQDTEVLQVVAWRNHLGTAPASETAARRASQHRETAGRPATARRPDIVVPSGIAVRRTVLEGRGTEHRELAAPLASAPGERLVPDTAVETAAAALGRGRRRRASADIGPRDKPVRAAVVRELAGRELAAQNSTVRKTERRELARRVSAGQAWAEPEAQKEGRPEVFRAVAAARGADQVPPCDTIPFTLSRRNAPTTAALAARQALRDTDHFTSGRAVTVQSFLLDCAANARKP